MECSAKDVNKLYFHSQDGTCHIVSPCLNFKFAAYVKIIGTLDMFAQTAVQLFTTDQPIATVLDPFCSVAAVHAILMRLENSQDHAIMFKFLRVLSLAAATASFAVKVQSGRQEMTSGGTAIAEKF